ncbi:TetR/AcrR family transcriptional regulator [Peribacillus saganii]|uniref:TetR/AcrR family transcriptional regulator n=1 Tax=Peribacillus saganii TaxID=2303992 RepID=A0A372LJB2_9BACI|nr:forespore capture DNA-binding protein RefZ [Peribacillus saganii]RFU66156.1 TetR/AcrR family transcriptional regulator [Peribacillus saganii]
MKNITSTKEAIIDAALYLFHLKGFHAASIRDIAGRAGVNPANISYYFKNKHGLLEYCIVSYMEEYTSLMSETLARAESIGSAACMFEMVNSILHFQRKHFLSARFIFGEFSLDSNLNREILSTYLARERYHFETLIEHGIRTKAFRPVQIPVFILQLKGLLSAPLIHASYAAELLHIFSQEAYYTDQYAKQVNSFLKSSLLSGPDAKNPFLEMQALA